jgi:hypothetical protein
MTVPAWLAFGGILFWILFSVFMIAIITCVEEFEKDGYNRANFGWPIFLNVVVIACLYFFYRSEINLGLTTTQIILFSLAYIGIGLAWSFFKWLKFVKYKYRQYLKAQNSSYSRTMEDFKPKVSEEKDQLISWIVFWPYSMVRYAFVQLLGDLMDELIKRFTGVYNTITTSQFKPVEKPENNSGLSSHGK